MLHLKPFHILMAIAVALIWGMGVVFAKAALDWFPPILLMAFRFAVTALALVWFVAIPRGLLLRLTFISFISATIHYSLVFTGLAQLDASTAILVIQLEGPFMVLLAAIFLKEAVSIKKVIGICIAFAGVAIIAGEPRFDGNLWPVMITISGSILWAIGQLFIRKLAYSDSLGLIAWIAALATPQLFVMSLLFEGNPLPWIQGANWVVWATVVYLGIVMTAVGYGLWYRLLLLYPIPLAAPWLLLVPVASIAGGVMILGESLSKGTLVGGAVVIAGVALITIERVRRNTP